MGAKICYRKQYLSFSTQVQLLRGINRCFRCGLYFPGHKSYQEYQMGLTIHWGLRSSTRSPKQAREKIAQLRGRALDLPFEQVEDIVELTGPQCDFENCKQDDPNHWLLIQAARYVERPVRGESYSYNVAPNHVIAFETLPGDGCEAANFGFCKYPTYIEVDDPQRCCLPRQSEDSRASTRQLGY
jgi:hypothetical protein